jgi:hypothetical protein
VAAATTLAEDATNADGTIAHRAGAPVVWVYRVNLAGVGSIAFPVPLPSELLLRIAGEHLEKATKHRLTLVRTSNRLKGGGVDFAFSDYQLAYEFFQQAMAGVMLTYAALDNFVNEQIDPEFQFPERSRAGEVQHYDREAIIRMGLEKRMSRVLAAATQRPNIRTEHSDLWNSFLGLKELRDAIEHARRGGRAGYISEEDDKTVFAQLLRTNDLTYFYEIARKIFDLYPKTQTTDEEEIDPKTGTEE